ncbi:MAG: SMI1/KNR4 family protein [Pseudonocardiaceae bacterium]
MSEQTTWPVLIGTMGMVKEQINKEDTKQLADFTIPRFKATEEQIKDTEERLGEPLPASYSEFLLHANGWDCFFWTLDLFGTEDLTAGPRHEAAAKALTTYDDAGALEALDLTMDQVIPIGIATNSNDLLILIGEGHPDAGKISWIDGEEIDRYNNFAHYFTSMIEYQRLYLDKLRAETYTKFHLD